MRRFFENKFAFAAVVALFLLGFAWNLLHGPSATVGSLVSSPVISGALSPDTGNAVLTAHGPLTPPDPWPPTTGSSLRHGPLTPPDPWPPTGSSLIAHGPLTPPDPWPPATGSSLRHGPLTPPDPWPPTGSSTIA
jgi:hypothetical protein